MDEIQVPDWEDLEAPQSRPFGVTTAEFRRRVLSKEPTEGLGFMQHLVTKRATPGEKREISAVAAASSVDLEKDTVSIPQMVLKFYRTNPILLPQHDRLQLPIGVAVKLSKSGDELRPTFRYAPPEISKLADAFYQNHLWRLEQKALGDSGAMFSVFAMPEGKDAVKFNRRRGGIDFGKSVLWEISDVTIGAQPRARLLAAKAAGVPMEPVLEWALDLVKADESVLLLERERAERVVKTLDPTKGLEVFEIDFRGDEEPVEEDDQGDRIAALEKRLEALESAPAKQEPEPEEDPPEADPAPAEVKKTPAEPTEDEIEEMAGEVLKAIDRKLVTMTGSCL